MTSPARLTLCSNCLENGGQDREIGPERGHQMDSYRSAITLCATCWDALYKGDMRTFASRYSETRQVSH